MNITSHAIKLIFALLITMSFCVNADITEQEEHCLNDALAGYDIERLTAVGTTAEEVFLFSQKAPMISPYDIHRFTRRNITPEVVASFHPEVAGEPAFIDKILQAGLSPQKANSYLEAGVDQANILTSYFKNGIAPDLAGALYKSGYYFYTDSDYSKVWLQETMEKGLTMEDLPRYKGLASTTNELKRLYVSKVPTDFLHRVLSMDITLDTEDAKSLYFRGIDLDTYPSLISDERTCTAYPTTHLEFEHLGNLAGYQSKKEPIPLPKALFFRLNTVFSGRDFTQEFMGHFSTDDQEEIFKYVENKAKRVKNPTIYNLLYLTAEIVSEKLHYELVDEGELEQTFPIDCSIAEYWRRGIGDCDKYSALGTVVFAQLKQLFPDVMANVYLINELFAKYNRHSWNTVVIAEEDRLIFSYIDITYYDPGDYYYLKLIYRFYLQLYEVLENLREAAGYTPNPYRNKNEALGAMYPENFNKEHFLSEYKKYFCPHDQSNPDITTAQTDE
ncbi:hypothetical protein [Endozoicomonas sp. ALD040]|uniref:hypothetical protein n=1 Tax=Endozoicomonas sp. ALD040 TaxID=3403079 RepID=UPI003BAF6722